MGPFVNKEKHGSSENFTSAIEPGTTGIRHFIIWIITYISKVSLQIRSQDQFLNGPQHRAVIRASQGQKYTNSGGISILYYMVCSCIKLVYKKTQVLEESAFFTTWYAVG